MDGLPKENHHSTISWLQDIESSKWGINAKSVQWIAQTTTALYHILHKRKNVTYDYKKHGTNTLNNANAVQLYNGWTPPNLKIHLFIQSYQLEKSVSWDRWHMTLLQILLTNPANIWVRRTVLPGDITSNHTIYILF